MSTALLSVPPIDSDEKPPHRLPAAGGVADTYSGGARMGKGICAIPDCDSPAHNNRGWCSKHYQRWRAHGDPTAYRPNPAPRKSVEERFWPRVDKSGECWLWTGATTAEGYGLFSNRNAHRIAYELLIGAIPDGLNLDHLCHTNDAACAGGRSCVHRRCVNPAHLEPVTQRVNVMRSNSVTAVNARRTHCGRNHEYTPENTRMWRGIRMCRACERYRSEIRKRRP